jgi:NAD(P)-dependent dehydrogenase (short-subunit alcohol dehydrogenase family)
MESKVAVVTGASSGIGLGIVKALLGREWSVVGVSRRAVARGTLVPSPRLALVEGDVAQRATADEAVATAVSRFGGVHLLVNNAGIFASKPFLEYSADDYAALLGTNVAGTFHMTQVAVRQMLRGGRGHIVNISTSLVTQPLGGVPAALPILTKGGLEAMAQALAIELASKGIRVNTVAPGIIDTPMHQKEHHAALAALSPAKRIGTTQEVVDAVLYLDGATFVSGEVLHVDGGAHAGTW